MNLDAGHDAVLLEVLDERDAVVGFLIDGLVEQNHAADVLAHLFAAAQQHLPILATSRNTTRPINSSRHNAITHTHTRLTAHFRDYPGEPVPER